MVNFLEIIMTKGLPGSGKSTWSKDELRKNPTKYKRINKDLMRTMFDGGISSPEGDNFIFGIRPQLVEAALRSGYSVIIDDTNFSDKGYLQMCEVARRVGNVKVWEKFFEVDYKVCLKRNAERPNPIPEHILTNMYDKYLKHKRVEIRSEYFPPREREFVPEIIKQDNLVLIVDLDGTLALNQSGRSYYDMLKVDQDTPHTPIVETLRAFKAYWKDTNNKILMVSGRDDSCRESTKFWLEYYDIPFDDVLCRKEDDHRTDHVVKKEIYQDAIKDKYTVLLVLDDRTSVVEMWRSLGLTVLQVENNTF